MSGKSIDEQNCTKQFQLTFLQGQMSIQEYLCPQTANLQNLSDDFGLQLKARLVIQYSIQTLFVKNIMLLTKLTTYGFFLL